ncbi:MAG: FprA family A-type flavoprotein, partial [Lawsonibacter sp.]|nr:FprA family A-type flavoprotein [Lawsonibacter sp.]
VSVAHYSQVLSDCFKYSHIVFAAPTFNNGIFDPMEHLLRDLAHHNLQNRKAALIQNGSWAPASGKLMTEILGGMKNMELIEAPFTLKSALAPGQERELEVLAQTLAASVKGGEPAPVQEEAPKPKGFICKICGFIYESDTLPDDYVCPICRRPASDFEPVQ